MPQSTLNPYEEKIARLLHNTPGITLGTTAPFSFDEGVTVTRIGFADIPVCIVRFHCKPEDTRAMVPLARAMVYAELRAHGISDEAVEFVPTRGDGSEMGGGRRRLFTDENPSSSSCGKRKQGQYYRFTFEIKKGWLGCFEFDFRRGKMKQQKPPE